MLTRLELLSAPLTGRHVRLEPLSKDHIDGLTAAATADRSTFEWTMVPEDREAMARYVQVALDVAAVGGATPFATIDAATNRVVGSTRFANLEFVQLALRGDDTRSVRPYAVEIGWTWLTPSVQRTGINTEAKLLMLTHAFERWGVHRVMLKTNVRNERSRAAIQRLGATFDGAMRNYLPGGITREAVYYSLLEPDWPAAKERLERALAARSTQSLVFA
ncbi:MAG: GNAT family protein [Polyangiaceae bacterium]